MKLLSLFALSWTLCQADQSPVTPADNRALAVSLVEIDELSEQAHYERAYELALKVLRQAEGLGPNHFQVGATLRRIGLLHHRQGRHQEAETVYRRAMRILENDVGHRLVFAQVLQNLASLYMDSGGRYAQAQKLMQRAVELGRILRGPDHPDLGGMLANLASAHMLQGHDSEARTLFDQALAILEKSRGVHQANTASVLSNLGFLTFRRGDSSHALTYMLRSIDLCEQTLGPAHPELVIPLINVAQVYLATKRASMAEEPLRRAAAIAAASLGSEHPLLGDVLSTYAVVLRKSGRKKEAREMQARAKAIQAVHPSRAANSTVHIADLVTQRRRNSQK